MLRVSRLAVQKVLRKHREGYGVLDKPKSGRPKKLNERATVNGNSIQERTISG